MAVTLNASTTSGFVQSADTSGIIQLQSNGTTIATISSTGLQQNVGAPAFSAYLGSNQSVSSGVNTKVQCNTEEFDTNSNYDNATNYRFTPTVAGYYQFNYQVSFRGSTNITRMSISLYKNGSGFKNGTDVNNGSNNGGYKMAGSALCYEIGRAHV